MMRRRVSLVVGKKRRDAGMRSGVEPKGADLTGL